MAAKKGSKRESYSVYLLQHCKPGANPTDPETQWITLAEFGFRPDCVTASRLLGETDDWKEYTFAIDRVVRLKESTPKTTREIV